MTFKNERITEGLCRTHFAKQKPKGVVVEEQKSANSKINKLLQTASKSGGGAGKPEFIISGFDVPHQELLILIECKADVAKHESKTRDKYKDYAVDGGLLYSSYLSKEYDVLTIAVSGQKASNLKISHFLQLKGQGEVNPIFKDKLLSYESYLKGYIQSDEKFTAEYDKILEYSKELNDKLHSLHVAENHRALLISSILIALGNKPFSSSYTSYSNGEQLAKALITAVENELKNNIQKEKAEKVISTYSFIRTHTTWENDSTPLRDLISEVDKRVNNFIRTYQYYDILGQFYIEFLRYANMDKSLGIVLTPPHITELFAHLGSIDENSIVYDSCCGTGGFLISAMQKMIGDTKGDENKIKLIKKNQLIGVEFKDHIYTLAVSNMFMHGDGKTQIFNGNCFDKNVKKQIKSLHPTVGFLNPPYKADKKKDIEEFQFILDNLDCLQKGATCVAIIPVERCLQTDGKAYELKKRLLKEHTLEGVFSMPDELFYTSKVGVVTCILVITAHQPHPKNKQTFFGYWKTDGFKVMRHRGRIPVVDWKAIQTEWLKGFRNRLVKAGESIMKEVSADDEWCAEAYMETNYLNLKEAKFIKEVKKYASFNMLSQTSVASWVSALKISQGKTPKGVALDVSKWNYFKLKDLFDIEKGKEIINDSAEGEIPLVSATYFNNGISGYVENPEKTFPSNTITVPSNGASTGEAFYQPIPYCATGDVNILKPKHTLDKWSAVFLATILRQEKYRFNYGRKWGKARMEDSAIKLPVDKNVQPDWKYMTDYIKSLSFSVLM